jgi:hypothetical protein
MPARIALRLDEFGWSALTETADRYGLGLGEFVAAGCRRFLAQIDRAETLPPLASRPTTGTLRWVRVELEPAELGLLEQHARRQRTGFELLLRQTVISLVADLDSGRLVPELGRLDHLRNADAAGA